MNKVFFLLFILAPALVWGVKPCKDYSCDYLVVRGILDRNGLKEISVKSVTQTDMSGRINWLKLIGTSLPKKLTVLPASIGRLTALKGLYLRNNEITFLPPEIGNLVNITWLDLGINKLTGLPWQIGKITKLEWLYLPHNQLTSLPRAIGVLKKLKLLNLRNNHLTSLPKEIRRLKKLNALNLESNYLCSVPEDIAYWIEEDARHPWWNETQDCRKRN